MASVPNIREVDGHLMHLWDHERKPRKRSKSLLTLGWPWIKDLRHKVIG